MRIIGGNHRSRKLLSPKDDLITRPITDRVKQSLFDRLWSEEVLGGGNVLDIFAGVGSLGLEAISRGADHCTFIERHKAIRTLLEQNLEALGESDAATVLKVDAMMTGWVGMMAHQPLRLVFCDPPYDMTRDEIGRVANLIKTLVGLMEPEGLLVLRSHSDVKAPEIEGWLMPRTYIYGSMATHLYNPLPSRDDGEAE